MSQEHAALRQPASSGAAFEAFVRSEVERLRGLPSPQAGALADLIERTALGEATVAVSPHPYVVFNIKVEAPSVP
jgi:hypothetical protein